MKMKRALSLVLMLAMVLSLGVLPASAEDIEIVDVDGPAQEIDAVNYPAQQFSYYEPNGLSVDVKAPAGALPRGTTMEVSRLADLSRVQNAVDRAEDLEGTVALAADISFWHEGEEVEPVEGNKILVTMTAPEIAELNNPVVVHVPDEDPAVAERIDPLPEEEEALRMGDQVAFEAEDFSVYAIIGNPEDEYSARVTINFYKTKGDATPIATMYVKEADTAAEVDEIVYDPGVPDLTGNTLFQGWCRLDGANDTITLQTEALSIEKVREQILALNITDDMTVDYYAVIYKYFNVSYFADGLCYGTDTVLLLLADETASYPVSMLYTAGTEQDFKGWKVSDGIDHIVSGTLADENHTQVTAPVPANTVFPNDSVIEISGNVKFDVEATDGHWLVFHENPDGETYKGATYIAPQFLEQDGVTVDPQAGEGGITMKCPGYTFDGWYLGTTDAEGNFTGYTTRFTFGNTIDTTTHVYAKWSDAQTAFYTLIIWKQNIDGDDYDFVSSTQITATPGSSITYNPNASGAYSEEGFHFDHYDTGKTVKADSSTIVNVYYDRTEYHLYFQIPVYTNTSNPNWNSGTEYYVLINNVRYPVTRAGNYSYYPVSRDSMANNGTYYVIYENTAYQLTRTTNDWRFTYGNRYYYLSNLTTWQVYARVGNNPSYSYISSWQTIHTVTALYQQDISGVWSFTGSDGVQYPQTNPPTSWQPVGSSTYTARITRMEIMPSEDITFHHMTTSKTTRYFHYYVEALAGDTNTRTFNGMQYSLYTDLTHDFQIIVYEDDFWKLSGFTRQSIATAGNTDVTSTIQDAGTTGVGWDDDWNSNLYFYYTRNTYTIKYLDGAYFGGKNGDSPMTVVQENKELGESSAIFFNADISEYGNKDNAKTDPKVAGYYTPTPKVAGYLFAGWYVDDSCSTEYDFNKMPLEGVTVYAKWVQCRYRVFLHPNVPESDQSLNWGSGDQQMNFGVAWGDKISAPFGTRDGYTFLGWTRADGSAFNANFIELTDDTVPAEPVYDKTVDFTDTMNKYGNIVGTGSNSDANRFFVVRKLDLYGKWRKDTPGAEGIYVAYDLNGGTGSVSDTSLYPDNTDAVAQTAPATAPDAADGSEQHFLYWVVQTWDNSKGEYVDAVGTDGNSIFVSPGSTFTVLLDNAKKEEKWQTDDSGNYVLDGNGNKIQETKTDEHGNVIPQWIYTVQLRAEYGPVDTPTPSHIYWYANNETTDVQKDENVQINVGVNIPTTANYNPGTRAVGLSYPGHVFLGWARVSTGTTVTPTSLDADDLFLKWVANENEEGGGHYLAQDDDNNWVAVTQVACDEKNPYHDLYAVWGKAFYVYHSSTKQVERILLTTQVTGFDLTKLVDTSTYLYGGYYSAYAGASSGFVSDVESLSWTEVASVTGYNNVTQINSFAADGFVAKAVDTNGTAYDGKNVAWSNPYTAAGNSITPQGGMVYYIKEVPAATFLQPRLRFTYVAATGKIGTSWLITNIDDTNYTDVGFMVGSTKVVGSKVDSITITPLTVPANEQTFTVADLFPNGGAKMSYAMVYNDMSTYPADYEAGEGETDCNILTNGARVHMFWVTPDGMMVTSTAVRTYSNIGTANGYSNGLSAAQSTQTSTISLYQAS